MMKNHIHHKIVKPVICLLLFLFMFSCKRMFHEEFTVLSGDFRQSIIESGEIESVDASFITMPRINSQYGYYFKIIGLIEHGKTVHKGDSVAAIDPSFLYKYIIEKEESLEIEKAAANKQKVQMENSIQELQAQLKSEEAAYELKNLELERIEYESDAKKRVKELEFQQAAVKLNKVKRNLELKPVLEDYNLKIQKIKVMQHEAEIKDARETLKSFTICSPSDGLFQVQRNIRTNQNTRLGDEVSLGSMIARIPDISKMKALSYVNETDIQKVRLGTKVIVRLDALPYVSFNGVITDINKICENKEREKIFRTEVEIIESDLRMKPGMTVSCEYIFYESDNDLFVPNNCLLKQEGHSYIFLKNGGSPKKLEVKSGPANSNYTVISGDVKPGQQILLSQRTGDNQIN